MARPVWKGSISFGLVSVPVKAYTAARDHTVHFHQLERETGARVRNRTVSEKTGEDVERDDMVLGYELGNGKYVTFERDELDELRPASTKALKVQDFVPLEDVDPIHFQRTYWLGPDGEAAEEPYALLVQAMEHKGRVGVGSVVMRNKQYLAAVRPLDGAMALSTMRFADEVVDRSTIEEIPAKPPKTDPKALKLADQIIDGLAADWDPSQYRDTYVDEVKDIITAKAKGKTIVPPEAEESAEVIDLMEALRASVDAAKDERAAAKRPAKRSGAKKEAAKKSSAKKRAPKKTARKSA